MGFGDDDKKKGFGRRWGEDPDKAAEIPQDNSAKIDELLRRAQPLIEQINSLYTMFMTGVERLPPLEKRKQLDMMMTQLQSTPKPNQTYGFKAGSVHTHYTTMRDRWDRIVRDVESGKIKRTVGPNKGK